MEQINGAGVSAGPVQKSMKTGLHSHWRQLLYCLLVSFCFLLIASRSSWLYPMNDWVDSQSYFTMGRGLFRGKVLYRDLFEQKGPYVYFIYGLGSLISARTFAGVFLFEVLFFAAFLYEACELIRCYSRSPLRWLAALPVIAAIITQSSAFYRGGSAEQMALPVLMYSLASIGRYHESRRRFFPGRVLFWNGFAAGVLFLSKYTLLGIYPVFLADILISYRRRHAESHLRDLRVIPVGFLAALAPWLIYFLATGSLADFLQIYFIENASVYSRVSAGSAGLASIAGKMLKDIFIGTGDLRRQNALLFRTVYAALAIPVFSSRNRSWTERLYPPILFLMMFSLLFAGGIFYIYYPLPVAVFLPWLFCWRLPHNSGIALGSFRRKAAAALLAAAVMALSLRFVYLRSDNTPFLLTSYVESSQAQFADVIDASDDPTLLNLGWLDGGFYTAAGVLPTVRYFQNNNLPRSRCLEYQLGYVRQRLTNFVIINQVSRTVLTEEDLRLLESGYREIGFSAWHGEEYWLYQRIS